MHRILIVGDQPPGRILVLHDLEIYWDDIATLTDAYRHGARDYCALIVARPIPPRVREYLETRLRATREHACGLIAHTVGHILEGLPPGVGTRLENERA